MTIKFTRVFQVAGHPEIVNSHEDWEKSLRVCSVPLFQPSSRDLDYPLGFSAPEIKMLRNILQGSNFLDFTKKLHIYSCYMHAESKQFEINSKCEHYSQKYILMLKLTQGYNQPFKFTQKCQLHWKHCIQILMNVERERV